MKVFGLLFFSLTAFVYAGPQEYVVGSGETFLTISQKSHVPIEILKKANPLLDLQKLSVGEHLLLPETYVVKSGDTLYSLAKSWSVEILQIQDWNNLTSSTMLKVGAVLFVPMKPDRSASNQKDPNFWPLDGSPQREDGKLRAVTFAASGQPFRSVCDGTAIYTGEFRGIGRVILVQNSEKTLFAFGNFESSDVKFGQKVKKGQILGLTSSRAQRLYFFAFRQGEALDPFDVRR